jgi:KipI family sensor histidine kinase inhibitor
MEYKVYPLSENAITLEWGNKISVTIYEQIANLNRLLNENPFLGFVETVPAYTTLTIFYEPELILSVETSSITFVKSYVEKLLKVKSKEKEFTENYVTIPVCYDEEFGLDLQFISETSGISIKEIINLHQQKDYNIYMTGFLPGFSYMGKVDDKIAVARKDTPRTSIEEGAVGIAGNQTGIYPIASPGGWQIIGKTPYRLFDIQKKKPFLLKTGDTVRFYAISKDEFYKIKKEKNNVVEKEIDNSDVIVMKPGVFSTVQDIGRVGFRSFGVPLSGAMDLISHNLANALLGNKKSSSTIECTMGGLTVQFFKETNIAVTGAGVSFLNGECINMHQAHFVKPNDILEVRFNNQGLRTYVAVKGGFDYEVIMNSRSTSPKIAIGRMLKKGMGLQFEKGNKNQSIKKLNTIELPLFESHKSIRVIEGQEIDWVKEESVRQFYSRKFVISNRCDRMGYHLQGEPLLLKYSTELLSTAVTKGTIQLTPSGQMIVLMNDCQTTGGYPRIGQVAAVDLPFLAQLKPRESIDFKKISFGEAELLYINQQKTIDEYFS